MTAATLACDIHYCPLRLIWLRYEIQIDDSEHSKFKFVRRFDREGQLQNFCIVL